MCADTTNLKVTLNGEKVSHHLKCSYWTELDQWLSVTHQRAEGVLLDSVNFSYRGVNSANDVMCAYKQGLIKRRGHATQTILRLIIGASEASPFLVMNVAILSVCVSVCVSWTGTIFVFCTCDPLPNFT